MGVVTGVSKGFTSISCEIKNKGETKILTARVGVRKPAVKMEITSDIKQMMVGDRVRLTKKLTPKTSNDYVTWTSDDESVIQTDRLGNLVAKKQGSATITGTTLSGRKDSIKIEVLDDQGVIDPDDSKPVETAVIFSENFETTNTFKQRGTSKLQVAKMASSYEGFQCLSVTERTASWAGATVNLSEFVQIGATYEVSAYVKQNKADGETIKLTWQKNGGEAYIGIASQATQNGEWTLLKGSFTVEENTKDIELYIETDSTIDFLVDDITIIQTAAGAKDVVEEIINEAGVVYKSDFEKNSIILSASNLFGTCHIVQTDEKAHSGASSMKVHNREAAWAGAGIRFSKENGIDINEYKGKTLHLSGWFTYDGPGESMHLNVNNYMDDAKSVYNTFLTKGEWTFIETDFYVSPTTEKDLIYFESWGEEKDSAGYYPTIYFDDITITTK